jgi:abortive infection alpha-like protein
MPTELIRPIDPDSAHAIEETAKAVAKAIDAAVQAGKYVGEVLGDLPHDLVGIMGDWVKQKRALRWAELSAETQKILRDRGVENREDISPSVAIPLIAGAINEDREVLKELWAKLLAAAMDANRADLVRPSLVDVLRQMDPLDALILGQLVIARSDLPSVPGNDLAERLAKKFNVSRDEAFFSLEHLYDLGCLMQSPSSFPNPVASAKGSILIRATSD